MVKFKIEDITQAGVKDINYHYEHTSKSRFGGLISKSTTSENYQENAIVSATVAGDKGLTYDSKNNLILSGVKVVSSGSIDLKGKNVEINPLETKSYSKFEEKKKGFSAKVSLKGSNYSYGKDKFSDNSSTIIENSNEIVAGKKLTIEADNKVKAKAVNIYSNDNISISGNNGVEISSGKNIQEREIKQSSTRINTGIGIKSSIVNTVENVKNIDKLADFSGDSYDIVNKASNLVGAIKDGADAVNTILDPSYNGSQGAGTENLSITDPKKYISVHSGVTRSKNEIKTYDESTNKSSITGKNIEINSKDKSVQIIGTDIAAKNLEISAKENIDISGASEEHRSSNSSSSSGLSVSATLDKAPLTITANISGAQGRSNGTYNINSNIVVDEKFKTESENLNISSSNIVADKVDIKAKNVVIESKQDKTESKNSSYGASVSVAVSPAGVELKNISVNGAKGKGKGSWTNAQTSVIAKNGGEITTDNFKDIGAIVGSENEKEKLKISAKTIEVKDLEDSNKYENVGGGISLDFEENKPQVPNISVVHDKIDKEQITRATAINTEIKVNNEIVKAEDLGFNTDISNSQETTKDKEKHLNAELHTDLLGKDKQEELKKAGGIISDIGTALTSSKDTKGDFLERYKQASMMRAIGDQVEKNPEYLSILDKKAIKNGKIDDKTQVEQVSVMNKLLNDALRAKGYAGPDIKMVLTDVEDPNGPYYTDTLTNVVVFDRKELAKSNRDQILNALGHEFGHYSKEDDIDKSQDIANHTGKLLEDRTKGMVSKEATEDTLARIRNNKNVITGEEGKKLAESIPMDRREYKGYGFSTGVSFSTLRGGAGVSLMHGISVNENNGEVYFSQAIEGGARWSPEFSFEIGATISVYPNVNQPEDFEGTSLGGSVQVGPLAGEISWDLQSFKLDSVSFGLSKSSKTVEEAAKKAILETPSIAMEIKPLKVLKKIFNVDLGIGASIDHSYLISKTKISTEDSEHLYRLVKEEKSLENHLKNNTLTKEQKKKLKEVLTENQNLQMELVKKIKKSRELKIPKVDSDAWD